VSGRSSAGRALRVNAVELLRQPGAVRAIDVVLGDEARAELDLTDTRISGDITVSVEAVSAVDGVAVHGEVGVPWEGECRRCLTPMSGVAVAELDEQFVTGPSLRDDALPIEGDQIDLAPIVREYVLLELPDGPLCRPDCPGVFPEYGEGADTRDPRWGALDQLRLDD